MISRHEFKDSFNIADAQALKVWADDNLITVPYTIVPDLYSFGTDTRAAYGGSVAPKILAVNSLSSGKTGLLVNGATEDEVWGRGTFEWCVEQTYPRIIVFEVGGLIVSNSSISTNLIGFLILENCL